VKRHENFPRGPTYGEVQDLPQPKNVIAQRRNECSPLGVSTKRDSKTMSGRWESFTPLPPARNHLRILFYNVASAFLAQMDKKKHIPKTFAAVPKKPTTPPNQTTVLCQVSVLTQSM
jgi:hypothetical protein